MNGTFGGKKGRPATSSELLRAVRIGIQTGANASYTGNLKKNRTALGSSDSILEQLISASVVAAFSGTSAVVNPYSPNRSLSFLFTQRLAANGLPVGAAWSSATSNSDGTRLAICSIDATGLIYTSADSGATWVARTSGLPATTPWSGIACTPDGATILVCSSVNVVYRSTNYGATWTQYSTQVYTWKAIAVQPDGTPFVVGNTDTGVSCSSNYLSYAACGVSGGTGYVVTNTRAIPSGGYTTVGSLSRAGVNFTSITESADGMKYAVCASTGEIYTSSNIGVTWTLRTSGLPVGASWYSITMSPDGGTLAVCAGTGLIYTSSDSGVTWTQQANGLPAGATWRSIVLSTAIQKLAVVAANGTVCTAVSV